MQASGRAMPEVAAMALWILLAIPSAHLADDAKI